MCVHVHVCSALRSYLARIGWQGRSSARLESWWPHIRTSLGLFPRCSQSAKLLQDRKWQREKGIKIFCRVCRKCLLLSALLFIQRCLSVGLFLLYFDPGVSSLLLLQHPIKSSSVVISVRHHLNGLCSHIPVVFLFFFKEPCIFLSLLKSEQKQQHIKKNLKFLTKSLEVKNKF